MQNEVFGDLQYAGVLTRNDLVGLCKQWESGPGYVPTSSGPLGPASELPREPGGRG